MSIQELVEEVVSKFHNLNMLVDERLIDEFREYMHASYEMGYQRGYEQGREDGYDAGYDSGYKIGYDSADDYNQERI